MARVKPGSGSEGTYFGVLQEEFGADDVPPVLPVTSVAHESTDPRRGSHPAESTVPWGGFHPDELTVSEGGE